MSGTVVCVVGPSGAGKDTLIEGARAALRHDPRFSFARRVVTRAASAAEDHDTVSQALFEERRNRAEFALCWHAHDLDYGIARGEFSGMAPGSVTVCNVSRSVVGAARRQFDSTKVVLVSAPRDVLHARLMARGREDGRDLDRRLERETLRSDAPPDLTIVNVGPVEGNIALFVDFLCKLPSPNGFFSG